MVQKCNRLQLESILMDGKKVADCRTKFQKLLFDCHLKYTDNPEHTFVSMKGDV